MPDRVVCDRCGKEKFTESHDRICQASPFDDDVCPMCGEAYESYTDHIQRCDGG